MGGATNLRFGGEGSYRNAAIDTPFPAGPDAVRLAPLKLEPNRAAGMQRRNDTMSLKSIGHWFVREIREILPPTIFFFIAFGLLLFTEMLVLKQHGIGVWHFGGALVGALIVGKVVLVADHFRFVDRYPDRPLIWNTLWKTLVYFLAGSLLHYLEGLLPLLFDGEGFVAANRKLYAGTGWTHSLLVHMWLAVLLFAYCGARELIRRIGTKEFMRMFFGSRAA
jgi:hypothetical protein